jgi:phage terminase large subunit-like protein
VDSPEYANVFKVKLADDSKSAGKWNTNKNGAYYAVGVGGALTGRGAHVLLIDDPVKNREEADSEVIREKTWDWYRSTARTRLAPGGAIVLIMTRWHDDDLAGRILASEGGQEWKVLKFPAIATEDESHRKVGEPLWPERYPIAELDGIKRDVGSYEWSSLYQQEPIDEASQEFKKQWFKSIEWDTVAAKETNAYLTIDTALSEKESSDFTGVVRNWVDKENKWHLKAYRMRLNAAELIDLLFTLHRQDHYVKIGIEKTAYLQALKPFLDAEQRKRNVFVPIVDLLHHQTQKEVRIRGLVPRYETGSVYHIQGECGDLEEEALRFPKGVHDDVLDSAAYQLQIAEPPHKITYNPTPNTPISEFETGVDPVHLSQQKSEDLVSEYEGAESEKPWQWKDAMNL